MELEYSQSRSFLQGAWRGLRMGASYTRSYASLRHANLIPHSVNGGSSYAHRCFNVYASAT